MTVIMNYPDTKNKEKLGVLGVLVVTRKLT